MHGLKTPDAIQIATAVDYGATAILTGDRDLTAVNDLEVLVVRRLAAP